MTVFLYVSYIRFSFSPDLLFWEFWLWYLSFLKFWSRHNSNNECILLVYIQHSQPHMTLYRADIPFNWGGNNECNVESLIIVLFSVSLASLSTPSNGSLTRLLWSSQTDTCSNNLGTICGFSHFWPSNFGLISVRYLLYTPKSLLFTSISLLCLPCIIRLKRIETLCRGYVSSPPI